RTNRIMEMFHARGARTKVTPENRKSIDYITIQNIDQKVYPVTMINAENAVLPGFIWRPQARPKSKQHPPTRTSQLPTDREQAKQKKAAMRDKIKELYEIELLYFYISFKNSAILETAIAR